MRRSLLALALAAPLISQPALLDPFWRLLSAVWADAGCIGDPSGGCAASLDEGCIADPNGRCAPAPQPQSDAGCIADPDGRPGCSS